MVCLESCQVLPVGGGQHSALTSPSAPTPKSRERGQTGRRLPLWSAVPDTQELSMVFFVP